MKKQAKGIIALSAVLVALLGGGLAYYGLSGSEDKEGSSGNYSSEPELLATQAAGQGTVLIGDDSESPVVKSVAIKNESGDIHVLMVTPPDENGANAVYTLEGYEKANLSQIMLSSVADKVNGLQAQSLIAEGCNDLGKYGLASPSAEIEVEFESGKKAKLCLGDKVPGTTAYYAVADGSKDVYSISASTANTFLQDYKLYLSMTVLEKPSSDDMPTVKSLRVERTDIDYDIYIEYDKSSEDEHSGGTSAAHKLIEPVESYLTVEKSTEVITGMFGLSAKDILTAKSTDADLEKAGLTEPFCKVTMACDDGNTHVLLLSEAFTDDDGNKCCYGMLEGENTIYIILTENTPWLTVQPIDICSRMLVASYVWNVTELSASSGEYSADFTIAPKEGQELPESPKSEDFTVKNKGEEFDSERYRQFFAFVIDANAEEFALDAPVPSGEPMATVKVTDSYFKNTTTFEFYDDSLMRSLIVVNGESKYYCTKAYVNTLIENIKRIGTGEDYITNW